jgi:predicted TIM-barrel fold metal-dependent hydrolase
VAGFDAVGGVVVSGSFQGTDQEYLRSTLEELGPRYVGVTMLPPDVPDAELKRLDAAGVRGLRLNLVRRVHTGDLTDHFDLARRARSLVGWHVELYVRSADLPSLSELLPPADMIAFDHLGLTTAGLPTLLALASEGARVKATGFSRGDLVVESALLAVHRANPAALMAGTDLPGTRAPRAVTAADLELLRQLFSPEDLRRITYHNAVELYRPSTT